MKTVIHTSFQPGKPGAKGFEHFHYELHQNGPSEYQCDIFRKQGDTLTMLCKGNGTNPGLAVLCAVENAELTKEDVNEPAILHFNPAVQSVEQLDRKAHEEWKTPRSAFSEIAERQENNVLLVAEKDGLVIYHLEDKNARKWEKQPYEETALLKDLTGRFFPSGLTAKRVISQLKEHKHIPFPELEKIPWKNFAITQSWKHEGVTHSSKTVVEAPDKKIALDYLAICQGGSLEKHEIAETNEAPEHGFTRHNVAGLLLESSGGWFEKYLNPPKAKPQKKKEDPEPEM